MILNKMNKITVRNLLIFLFFLSVCAGMLGYILVSGNGKIRQSEAWIGHTNQIIFKAHELSSLVEGMLASHRGYMLSRNDEFLNRYEAQKAAVSEHIANLSEMCSDNQSQTSRLDEIRNQFNNLTARIEVRTKEYQPIKIDEYLKGEIEIVDGLKEDILRTNDAVVKEETKLLRERTKALEKNKDRYFLILLIGSFAGAGALVIFNGFLFYIQSKRALAERSLKDTEERFSLAVQGTNDGIFDWDLKSGEIFYSKQFFGMLGYNKEAFTGTIQNFTELVHPDDLPKVWQYIERYLHHELIEYSNTFRMKHADGRWIWINSRAKAIFNRDGEAVRMVGAQTDITFMKEYQERLKAEKQLAEKENQAKSDFLAHMSHEIRTPLTAVSGIAEILLKNKETLTDRQMQLVKTLHSSTSTLKDIVNDILDFSKIESGELELENHTFPLTELLDDVRSLMAVNAREKGLAFTFDFEPVRAMEFYGDKLRFRQVLTNLIGNAIKFTENGSVAIKATKEGQNGSSSLRIEVADTGIGIAPENLDVIFERFKQADSSVSRRYGGTGLGLPISKNLVQLMGGKILLHSTPGQGSVFIVELPIRTATEGEEKDDHIALHKKIGERIKASLGAPARILIVEDYEGNILVLSDILEDIGCAYDIARTGLEALNMWKERHYDLLLMDVQMPEMDGFTATAQIRKMEAEKNLQRTPIIGMTAHALLGDKDKCIAAGMDAYFPKPVVETDLKVQILKFLNTRKQAA